MKKQILDFYIPTKKIISANRSYHYHQKGVLAKKLRELGYETGIQKNLKEKFNYCVVYVLIYPPTKRRFDPPNLAGTIKHIIDGLTDANFWDDDDYKHIKFVAFGHGGDVSKEKGIYHIKLMIEETTKGELL